MALNYNNQGLLIIDDKFSTKRFIVYIRNYFNTKSLQIPYFFLNFLLIEKIIVIFYDFDYYTHDLCNYCITNIVLYACRTTWAQESGIPAAAAIVYARNARGPTNRI